MRLTRNQVSTILTIVRRDAGEHAAVFLFGSRLNDQARGGDVDLLIETDRPLTLLDRARLKMNMESDLCLPVDIVAKTRSDKATPFQNIARNRAVLLGEMH